MFKEKIPLPSWFGSIRISKNSIVTLKKDIVSE